MKRWLAALLAALLLALPLAGLAESPDELMENALDAGFTLETQISFSTQNLPFSEEVNGPLSDLLNAGSIYQLISREGRNAFALQLSGKDAFRADWELTQNRLYFQSNWLGTDVISFNGEELETTVNRMLQLFGGAAGVTLEDIEKQLEALFSQEDWVSIPDDSNQLLDFLEGLSERVEVSDVTQQPRNCDPAETVYSLTLTAEDIAQYYEIAFSMMRNNQGMMNLLQQMNFTATLNGESMSVTEAMDRFPEMIREQAENFGEIPVEIYLDSNNQPVMVTSTMSYATNGSTITMPLVITRQTTIDGIGWALNVELAQDDVALAGITLSYLADSQTMDVFSLAVVAKQEGADDVEMLSVSYLAEKEYEDSQAKLNANLTFSFRPQVDQDPLQLTLTSSTDAAFDGESASLNSVANLFLTGEEEPIFTLTRTTGSIEAPASLSEGNVVTPGTMDDTEFQTFLNQELATLSASIPKALQLLPQSVLQILLSNMYLL